MALVPTAEGLMYGGTYGGEDGKIAAVGDIFFFGDYFIDVRMGHFWWSLYFLRLN